MVVRILSVEREQKKDEDTNRILFLFLFEFFFSIFCKFSARSKVIHIFKLISSRKKAR